MNLGDTGTGAGAVRWDVLGQVRVTSAGRNFSFCATSTGTFRARRNVRLSVGENLIFVHRKLVFLCVGGGFKFSVGKGVVFCAANTDSFSASRLFSVGIKGFGLVIICF